MDVTDVAGFNAEPRALRRWLFSTNHKDIGTMYLVFAIFAGVAGGALSIAMRLELQEPGQQYFDMHAYNVLMSTHGLIIDFLYSETIAKTQFWLMFVGINITFFPMHFLGLAGIADYPDAYAHWNQISSFGVYISAIGLFIVFVGVL